MKSPTILIADNLDEYRMPIVTFLKRQNYTVKEARNPAEARTILDEGDLDIAILDLRMEREDDPEDFSGLMLAVNTAPGIPKIILTSYPTVDAIRMAMRRIEGRLPAVVDFLYRGEGLDALLSTIKKILPLKDVFVVHGHSDAARLEVKEYLTKLHLNPITLQDLPNVGQTIIEKFEQASKVAYVIVLLTSDDKCLQEDGAGKTEVRARQNVIFELGYFMAKLGRARVCALYQEGVALPSDIDGVLWIKLDDKGAWKIAVAREMRAAGIYIDLNDIL